MPIADPRNRAISETKDRGELLTQPPPRGLPLGNGPTAFLLLRMLSGNLSCFLSGVVSCSNVCLLVCTVSDSIQVHWDRRRAGSTIFLGYLFFVWHVVCFCATGGGSRGGGVFGPLGTTVPWGVSSEKRRAAHGPRHPAVIIPLRLCLLGVCFLLRCFLGICMVSCVGFMVFGVEMLFGLVPFKTCPLFVLMFVSPSLFLLLFGMFADAVLSSCLFLSGAGEAQAPARGLGVPLVFLHHGHALRLQPEPRAPHL